MPINVLETTDVSSIEVHYYIGASENEDFHIGDKYLIKPVTSVAVAPRHE